MVQHPYLQQYYSHWLKFGSNRVSSREGMVKKMCHVTPWIVLWLYVGKQLWPMLQRGWNLQSKISQTLKNTGYDDSTIVRFMSGLKALGHRKWKDGCQKVGKGNCFRRVEFSVGKTESSEIDGDGLSHSNRNAFKSTKEHMETRLKPCIVHDLLLTKILKISKRGPDLKELSYGS